MALPALALAWPIIKDLVYPTIKAKLGQKTADTVASLVGGVMSGDTSKSDKQLSEQLDAMRQSDAQQVELLKIDAQSNNWFQSMPRPAFLWLCLLTLAFAGPVSWILKMVFPIYGLDVAVPEIDTTVVGGAFTAALGLYSVRGIEKHHIRKGAK